MNALEVRPNLATRDFAISLLTGVFRTTVESLPEELADKTEVELEDMRKPSTVDYLLRKNFWKQVDMAHAGGLESVSATDVYGGICSRQNFEKRVLKDAWRVAWLMLRPTSVPEMLEAGLDHGLKNLIKFISKEPSTETAGAFMKAVEFLYTRVHGPVVQRIDARHAHAHLNMKNAAESPEEVKSRIEELKAKLIGSS